MDAESVTTTNLQNNYSEMSGGANHSRLISMTYPNGRVLSYTYAAGLDDAIGRLSSISDASATLESYTYIGLGTLVKRAHPQTGVDLTYIGAASGEAGFALREISGPQEPPDGAFINTAALMTHLDLVITSDTSIAHLAGALARPVWVALSFNCCWRWMLERDDTPWYPTMRLFRQDRLGEWRQVFDNIAEQLLALADTATQCYSLSSTNTHQVSRNGRRRHGSK